MSPTFNGSYTTGTDGSGNDVWTLTSSGTFSTGIAPPTPLVAGNAFDTGVFQKA
jgi:hypothetical protein